MDGSEFDASSLDPARLDALRSAWNIAPGTPVILQAARLTRWKGQPVVLEALAMLRSEAGDWVAVFAGDDQGRTAYSQELERQAASLGLTARLRFVGHVSDMPAAFALASQGHRGVPMFFVISGYCIYAAAQKAAGGESGARELDRLRHPVSLPRPHVSSDSNSPAPTAP